MMELNTHKIKKGYIFTLFYFLIFQTSLRAENTHDIQVLSAAAVILDSKSAATINQPDWTVLASKFMNSEVSHNKELYKYSKEPLITDGDSFNWKLSFDWGEKPCTDCAEVEPKPKPKPLLPCKKDHINTHTVYDVIATVESMSSALKESYIKDVDIDKFITVKLEHEKPLLLDSFDFCENCSEVEGIPKVKPLIVGCE